jgi:hypothetical protein
VNLPAKQSALADHGFTDMSYEMDDMQIRGKLHRRDRG